MKRRKVGECHDEIALLRSYLTAIEEMKERKVAGCLTVNAGKLKRELLPPLEEKLQRLIKFTNETEREMTELKFQLDGEKTRFEAAMVKLEEQQGHSL